MIKAIALFLISFSAFSATPILTKHATSGFVMPEHSFVKDCSVSSDGTVESKTVKGDGTAISFAKQIPQWQVGAIRRFNRLARKGKIIAGGVICDGGDLIQKGFWAGKEFVIDENFDCGESNKNTHPAAGYLRAIATNLCGF